MFFCVALFSVREEEGRAGKGREGGRKRGKQNPEPKERREEGLRKGEQRRKKS